MNEIEPIEDGTGVSPREIVAEAVVQSSPRLAATFTKNSVLSVGRLVISTAVGFVLPSFLVHRLPVSTYSAWVLILQMSAYVNYLDFGIQTGIAKYVAEFEARGDTAGSSLRASAGLMLLLMASSLGVVLTLVLAWRVPEIFHQMPPALYRDVRLGLIFVGCSASLSLLCSIFGAIFTGLQRFGVPMALALVNRVLFTLAVLGAVYFHGSLAAMGVAVAVVNLATGLMYLVAWQRLGARIVLRLRGIDYAIVRQMLGYCSTLAVWTVAMLCISGLDVTIVGRYDFRQTAFYAIAATPANVMLALMGSALAPLMPTASALSVHRTPLQMGNFLIRITRYTTALFTLSALPLLVGGYWMLRVWVGPEYATHVVGYMRILVLGNLLRNIFAPYASMVVANGLQGVATASAIAETVVNLAASIFLVRRIGAIGVAYGTLLGSFVSVGMHLAVSMHYTHGTLAVARARLFLQGMVRPCLVAVPSLLSVRLWWRPDAPAFDVTLWTAWTASTLLIIWFTGLNAPERSAAIRIARSRMAAQPTQP